MLTKTAYLGSLSFIVACNTPTFDNSGQEIGARYDVTESGVVQTAIDFHDGSFVPPVAVSDDWLAMRPSPTGQSIYLPKGDSAPDLTYYHFGRSGLRYPVGPTPVGIEITGLDHWHVGNDIQFVSPNVGLSIHNVDTHFSYPADGSPTITGQKMNWAAAESPLIEAARGDSLWVAQMTDGVSTAGNHYSVLTHAGLARDFDLADGRASVINATLTPVTLNRTFELHWRGAPFAALASQAGPYASEAPAAVISIRTLPEPLAQNNNFARASYAYLPSLVDVDPIRASSDLDQSIRFGNPFANGHDPWTDFVTIRYAMPVRIPGVGATTAVYLQATPVEALAGSELAPAISPVRNVTIDGRSADAEQSGVGTTPRIRWEAPATGSPTNYAVTIRAIVPKGKSFAIRPAGTFYTRSTSLRIPAGATPQVRSYVVTVTAIAEKDRDLSTRPFVGALPYASADYVTALISP